MNEREAIACLRQGDITGLETLVRIYQVQAVRTAYLITHDRALAEEVVQEAFLRVWECIAQYDMARPFGPWFLRIVANDAIKVVTRQASQMSLEAMDDQTPWKERLSDPLPGPEESAMETETREAIWSAVCRLPPAERAAIVLRYYLGLSETDVAATLDRPLGTIKWLAHQARSRLRRWLIWLAPVHVGDAKRLPQPITSPESEPE